MRRPLSVGVYDDSPITYRGSTSSTTMNNLLNMLKTSNLRAYLRAQNVSRKLDYLYRAVAYENMATNNAVESLNFDYNLLNQVGTSRVVWRNFYQPGSILTTEGTEPAEGTDFNISFEPNYGQATLKQMRSVSKISVFQDNLGDTRVNRNVTVSTGNGTSPISTTEVTDRDDMIYTILDGQADTFWLEDDLVDTSLAVDVSFPVALTTKANVITVNPFPVRTADITNIQYYPLTGGTYTDVGIPDIPGCDNSHTRPIRTHFKPVDFNNGLRIIMTPGTLGNKKVYGLSDVNVEYVEYASTGFFYQDLKIPEAEDGYVIDKITSFHAYYWMDSEIPQQAYGSNPPVRFQIMTNSSSTAVYDSVTDVYPLTTSDAAVDGMDGEEVIRIKTTMNNIEGCTPILKGFRITYSIK